MKLMPIVIFGLAATAVENGRKRKKAKGGRSTKRSVKCGKCEFGKAEDFFNAEGTFGTDSSKAHSLYFSSDDSSDDSSEPKCSSSVVTCKTGCYIKKGKLNEVINKGCLEDPDNDIDATFKGMMLGNSEKKVIKCGSDDGTLCLICKGSKNDDDLCNNVEEELQLTTTTTTTSTTTPTTKATTTTPTTSVSTETTTTKQECDLRKGSTFNKFALWNAKYHAKKQKQSRNDKRENGAPCMHTAPLLALALAFLLD